MSNTPRIELPTNQDFGLGEVDLLENPADYSVVAPGLPGRSDDELRHAAEEGDWDLYATHEIDVHPLSYGALWHRFKDGYHGDTVDEPGGFINAVLSMQRTLPTAQEYAAVLAARGLIKPREAADLSKQSDSDLNTDKGADQARAQFKVRYLANATVPELRTAKLAAEYASNRIKAAARDAKADQRAAELMFRARGIEDEELRVLLDGLSAGVPLGRANRLRQLGIPGDLIEQVLGAPMPDPLNPRFKSAESIVSSALGSQSLDGQVAYRRFFGMRNLVVLSATHAVVEKPFDDKSLAFSKFAVSTHLAGTRLVESTPKADTPFTSMFRGELAAELGIAEDMAALGALASFMMREPALNGPQNQISPRSDLLGHNVASMVTADYRIWLDRQMAQEESASK